MHKVQKPMILSVIHHYQNTLDSTRSASVNIVLYLLDTGEKMGVQ
jgi:hypothetical protein